MLKNCKFKKNFRKRKNKFGILRKGLYLYIMKQFILTKQNDPREPKFYDKAFSHLPKETREKLRKNWIDKNIKKK